MAWIYLVIASFGEIFGMLAINLYVNRKTWLGLLFIVLSFSFGFFFLALAMLELSLSVSYAVWTGIGATGAVLLGALFFNERIDGRRILFLAFIILGAVGLRLTN